MNSYRVPVSVKGIVFEGDAVWLRKNERNEWELPGGKIEQGEQPVETVVREIKEELGFDVKVEKLIDTQMYQVQQSQDESLGVLVVSYLCRLLAKTGTFEIEGEAGKAEFEKYKLQEIQKLNMPQFYREAIQLGWEELQKI